MARIAIGYENTEILRSTSIVGVGFNVYGQIGNGTVGDVTTTPISIAKSAYFIQIESGSYTSYALDHLGLVWAWGKGTGAEIGDNALTSRTSPVSIRRTSQYSQLAAGDSHALIIDNNNGVIWSWGTNTVGQLGDNSITTRSSPVSVLRISSFVAIAARGSESFGIEGATGRVCAWGSNTNGELGDGTATDKSSPALIKRTASYAAIAASSEGGHAIDAATGMVWSWGHNQYGTIGDNTLTSQSSPVTIARTGSYTKIAAGLSHVLAIDFLGMVWGWGRNFYGQLGDNSTTDRSSPVSIARSGSYISINCGGHTSFAVESNGTIWAWGYSGHGQLANGSYGNALSPVSITRSASYIALTTGYTGTAGSDIIGVIDSSYNTLTWGQNTYGALGVGDLSDRTTPTTISNARTYVYLASKGYATHFIDSTGMIWGTGGVNSTPYLGNNTTGTASSPVSIARSASYTRVTGGFATHTLCIDGSTGMIWVWGLGTSGCLGTNNVTSQSSPVTIIRSTSYSSIAAGGNFSFAIDASTGMVWAWGSTANGKLGTNSITPDVSSPVTIARTGSYSAVSAGYDQAGAIDAATGMIWMWGVNSFAALGDNSVTVRSSPITIARTGSYSGLSCGVNYTLAIDAATGAIWSWGNNFYGQLGDGTLINRSSPVSVLSSGSFKTVQAGFSTSAAIDSNGVIWLWGRNDYNQLTTGMPCITSPISVGTLFNASDLPLPTTSVFVTKGILTNGVLSTWGENPDGHFGDGVSGTYFSNPRSIAGYIKTAAKDYQTSLYLDEQGNWWGMGYNTDGEIGNNTLTNYSVPVSVIRPGSYVYIHTKDLSTISIDSYGALVSTGFNASGQLGDNTKTRRQSPVLFRRSAQYIMAKTEGFHTIVLDDSGLVWGSGSNTSGQLGDNSKTSRSSPVAVAGLHSFRYISCNYYTSYGIDNQGHIWAWGANFYGQFGNNSLTGSSSPVSINIAGSFTKIVSDEYTTCALDGSTGTVYSWGINNDGELGINRDDFICDEAVSTPTALAHSTSYIDIGIGMALEANGTVWAWGSHRNAPIFPDLCTIVSPIQITPIANLRGYATSNQNDFLQINESGQVYVNGQNYNYGELGVNTWLITRTPTLIANPISFSKVIGGYGYMTALISGTGMIYTCSSNYFGECGDNTMTGCSSHVAIARSSSYKQMSIGYNFCAALDGDGTAWTWGSNVYGELGDNTGDDKSSPVSVVGGKSFQQISTGDSHCIALDYNGIIWTWGYNNWGQLGNNSTANKSSPISIAGTWKYVAAGQINSFAIDMNDMLWAWGYGTVGLLGTGTGTISTPKTVLRAGSYSKVVSYLATTYAIDKNTGMIYACGDMRGLNNNTAHPGAIGDNTCLGRTSFVAIARTSSYIDVSYAGACVVAQDADGSLWAWGQNSFGMLPNVINFNMSPVSVGKISGYTSFSRTRSFLLNSTSTHTNYIAYVSLVNDSRLLSSVRNQAGYDIMFFSDREKTQPLKHKLINYNPNTGTLKAFVLLPSVSGPTRFYMGYGDATVLGDNSSRETWPASYKLVMIGNEPQNMRILHDSGQNAKVSAVAASSVYPYRSGALFSSVEFTGVGATFTDVLNSFDGGVSDFSLGAWVSGTAYSSVMGGIVSKFDSTTLGYGLLTDSSNHVKGQLNTTQYDSTSALSMGLTKITSGPPGSVLAIGAPLVFNSNLYMQTTSDPAGSINFYQVVTDSSIVLTGSLGLNEQSSYIVHDSSTFIVGKTTKATYKTSDLVSFTPLGSLPSDRTFVSLVEFNSDLYSTMRYGAGPNYLELYKYSPITTNWSMAAQVTDPALGVTSAGYPAVFQSSLYVLGYAKSVAMLFKLSGAGNSLDLMFSQAGFLNPYNINVYNNALYSIFSPSTTANTPGWVTKYDGTTQEWQKVVPINDFQRGGSLAVPCSMVVNGDSLYWSGNFSVYPWLYRYTASTNKVEVVTTTAYTTASTVQIYLASYQSKLYILFGYLLIPANLSRLDDQWVRLWMTRGQNYIRLYANGIKVLETAITPSTDLSNSSDLVVGSNLISSFYGKLEYVTLNVGTELTPEFIADEYQNHTDPSFMISSEGNIVMVWNT